MASKKEQAAAIAEAAAQSQLNDDLNAPGDAGEGGEEGSPPAAQKAPTLDDLDLGLGFKMEPEAQAALDFDPFAPGGAMAGDPPAKEASDEEKAAAAAGKGEPAKGAPGATAEPKPDEGKAAEGALPADPAAPGTPAAPPVVDPRDTQIAALQTQVAALTQAVVQPAAAAPTATPEPERFVRNIPDQMLSLINSEDPAERKQGISALVQGTGNMVYDQVMQDVEARLVSMQTEIAARSQRSDAQSEVLKDFQGAFPLLADESFVPLIAAEGQKVAAETGATAWTPELRDAIGARLMHRFQGLFGAQQAAGANGGTGNGGNPPVPAAAPPALTPGGARPASPGKQSLEAEIEKVVFGT